MTRQLSQLPILIYIHWPYCQSKCTYCNFNKYVNPTPDHQRLERALVSELKHAIKSGSFEGRIVNSIYFGGGTPSLSLPSTFSSILNVISKYCTIGSNVEVTLEANPTSTELKRLKEFRDIGVNRLSLGIQSFNDQDLKVLGRDHSGTDALNALDAAKKTFGGNVTFDLIFGRMGQDITEWRKEVERGFAIADNHLSLYELTIKAGTPMYRDYKMGKLTLPNTESMADMYEAAIEIATTHGFTHYEVSNFARGNKYSRHNFGYWSGLDYLGIGPGAHGRITQRGSLKRTRTFRILSPEGWMTQCETIGHGLRKETEMNDVQVKEELLVFGLRTRMGIPRGRFKRYSGGQELDEYLNMDRVSEYIDTGFLVWNDLKDAVSHDWNSFVEMFNTNDGNGALAPTDKGLAVIDEILPRILP